VSRRAPVAAGRRRCDSAVLCLRRPVVGRAVVAFQERVRPRPRTSPGSGCTTTVVGRAGTDAVYWDAIVTFLGFRAARRGDEEISEILDKLAYRV
jgi:hypothetical protein